MGAGVLGAVVAGIVLFHSMFFSTTCNVTLASFSVRFQSHVLSSHLPYLQLTPLRPIHLSTSKISPIRTRCHATNRLTSPPSTLTPSSSPSLFALSALAISRACRASYSALSSSFRVPGWHAAHVSRMWCRSQATTLQGARLEGGEEGQGVMCWRVWPQDS